MNGKYSGYIRLVISLVGSICFAGLAVPSLAAGEVSTTINRSYYYEVNTRTVRVPPQASVSPVRDITPSVSQRGTGLSQTMPGSITINSVKTSPPGQTLSGSMPVVINVGQTALQAALFGCMRHIVCRAGTVAVPAGIELAMSAYDLYISDDQLMVGGLPDPSNLSDYSDPYSGSFTSSSGGQFSSAGAACLATYGCTAYGDCGPRATGVNPTRGICCGANRCAGTYTMVGVLECSSGSVVTEYGCAFESTFEPHAVSDELLQQVADSYQPQPGDWQFLSDSIPMAHPDVTVEVLDIPRLTGADSPNFIQNSDGTSTGTYSEYDFTVRNNNSSQPIIDVEETTVVTEYDELGAVTGTSTSTSTQVGAGAGSPVNLEVPTDCAFFPTACRFFDWVMSPFDEAEPAIAPVVEFDGVGREVEIGPISGACPAPYVIELSFVPSVEVSFEPLCDLGVIMRPLLLAIAAFVGAYLVVRSL